MDELYKPLGTTKKEKRKAFPFSILIACLLSGIVALGLISLAFLKTPLPQPHAIVAMPLEVSKPVTTPTLQPQTAPTPPKGPTITVIDGMTGRSREMPLNGPLNAPALEPVAPIPSFVSSSTRPLESYSAAFKPTLKQAALPRIAIIVGGKDLPTVLARLPQATTIAVPSLVSEAVNLADTARGRGLEVLLQLPPEETPKEGRSLKSVNSITQNSENLSFHLSKMQGYIGVLLPQSEKLTSSEAGYSSLLSETNKRGLLLVDDGAASSSLTTTLAKGLKVSALRIDIVLDSGNIESRFKELEELARRETGAVGYISAASIDKLLIWAKTAEAKGVMFAPLTAVLGRKGL